MKFSLGTGKTIQTKLIISTAILIFLIAVYFLSLSFYHKNLKKRIENINNLKTQIAQSQFKKERERKYRELLSLIDQKIGTSSEVIMYNIQQKTDINFEKAKNLILEESKKEEWQIIKSNFDPENKLIFLTFQIAEKKLDDFYNFMLNTLLILKTQEIKIEKGENYYLINLTLTL